MIYDSNSIVDLTLRYILAYMLIEDVTLRANSGILIWTRSAIRLPSDMRRAAWNLDSEMLESQRDAIIQSHGRREDVPGRQPRAPVQIVNRQSRLADPA